MKYANIVEPSATLIAGTTFYDWQLPDSTKPWMIDGDGRNGENLVEFAGRACYQSWEKPNARTATVQGYINHILEVAHLSVLEHASATFYFEGISRSCTHELVRHRHLSYSQLSQRYVDSSETAFVMPPEAVGDHVLEQLIMLAAVDELEAYEAIMERLEVLLADADGSRTDKRKRARQTARAILGNFTETKIVVTGNYRAWRHFVHMRASAGADTEIRHLAILTLRKLQEVAPAVFNDFIISDHIDGTKIAHSVLGREAE